MDVHHGDGVEAEFESCSDVLTLSVHLYERDLGDPGASDRTFFPGTGDSKSIGKHEGRYFTLNVPLHRFTSGAQYIAVFEHAVRGAFDGFTPSAVVLQAGCDCVAGDALGLLNVSIASYGTCVGIVRDLCAAAGAPLLVTGGGGYTPAMVPRCWSYATVVLAGMEQPYTELEHVAFNKPVFRKMRYLEGDPVSKSGCGARPGANIGGVVYSLMKKSDYVKEREIEIRKLRASDALGLPCPPPFSTCLEAAFVGVPAVSDVLIQRKIVRADKTLMSMKEKKRVDRQ